MSHLCPFLSVQWRQYNVEKGEIQIDPALCKRCGVCACVLARDPPSTSIIYEDGPKKIPSEIETLLAEGM